MNGLKGALCGIICMLASWAFAQSPHGTELKISCDACHTVESWTIIRDSLVFNHNSTRFALEGQHEVVECRACHTTLEFAKAETECASCHMDVHQQSLGTDCARCHNSGSWLINNIAEIHRQAAFPLLGEHAVANCMDCHKSETDLR